MSLESHLLSLPVSLLNKVSIKDCLAYLSEHQQWQDLDRDAQKAKIKVVFAEILERKQSEDTQPRIEAKQDNTSIKQESSQGIENSIESRIKEEPIAKPKKTSRPKTPIEASINIKTEHSEPPIKKIKLEPTAIEAEDAAHRADQAFAQQLAQMLNAPRASRNKPKIQKAPKKERVKREPSQNNPFNKDMHLSLPLQQLIKKETCSRPQVVKLLWQYIKANNLQDPKDKRQIICDDQMMSVFNRKSISMFTMNAYLKDHIYNPDDVVKQEGNPRSHNSDITQEKQPPTAHVHQDFSDDDSSSSDENE